MKIAQAVRFMCFGMFILIFIPLQAQNEPNDCDNIITVCGNGNFQSNATGPGNNPTEVNSCGGFEQNSIWLEINIVQGGTLGFDLIPDDPDISIDYNFWVYGPNQLCANLGSPIRCATTNPQQAGLLNNHTGINGSTTQTQTGPGANGNGYVDWLTVAVGETYFIVIDRPNVSGSFEIQWTGTAMQGAGAFPSPPIATAINDVIACSSTPNASSFDLGSLRNSINSDASNTVEFYENLADATDDINELPDIYNNTSNPQQIYAKVKSATTDCYSLIDFNLVVSPIPDAVVSVDRNTICEGESVTFTFTGTENTTVNYNINGGAAQQVYIDNSGIATLNQVLTVNSTLTLESVQVIDGSGTVICSQTLTDSETVTVNPSLTPEFTQVAPICSGETLSPLPTTSNNSITGTWSPALDNTTTTTYTFTPNAGQCATAQTMTITVNPIIIPEFTQIAPRCSGQNINPLPTTSRNGVTGSWSPAIDNTTTTIYTFTPDAGQCASEQTMRIIVSPTPIIDLDNLRACTFSGNGYFDFDLIAEIPNILGSTQDASDFTVEFFEDASASTQITTNPYTNSVAYTHTIYVQITDNATLCDAVFTFYLTVEDAALATAPNPINICDEDGDNDGFHQFDLTSLNTEVLNGQDPSNYIVAFFEDSQDAEDGINAITNPDAYTNRFANFQTIYIRVYHASSPDVCYATTSVNYTVNPVLKPLISSLTGNNTLCVDFETNTVLNSVTLVSDLQNANYVYTWYLNGTEIAGETSSELIIDTATPGIYTLSIEENTPIANCSSEISEGFEVLQSGPPVLVDVSQTETFEPNPRITVTVEGYGEYWFQLDDGPIEDNAGIFTSVSSGSHSVTVYDRKTENPSCGSIIIDDITIINYPKVLTPNNDGYNDTWHVFAVSDQPTTTVKIFDRYGKLLKQLRANDIGWDGTFRGQPLPANDYWFDLTYEENGELKHFVSHFSLKR
ncbi:hypothetical protein PK35_15640 [Tamlana nanhaiensis]|uniref:Ig-like domain-containing protein n=1 Tax=Neotamlana nanhaiensis TaxID=1382798 RepID=A0A0D7VWM9_9FLAO|nr:T9SS type B sorting domain-containing protein [Tamlana nanhaiensis]KJD31265.1 hypothetical protein PK35_15640 [Tamlana nanhaiensis]